VSFCYGLGPLGAEGTIALLLWAWAVRGRRYKCAFVVGLGREEQKAPVCLCYGIGL
jgi:hypothetical protein